MRTGGKSIGNEFLPPVGSFSQSPSAEDILARSILRNGIAPLRDLTHRISLKLVTEILFVHIVFFPQI